jgi:hypothetical protein
VFFDDVERADGVFIEDLDALSSNYMMYICQECASLPGVSIAGPLLAHVGERILAGASVTIICTKTEQARLAKATSSHFML